MWAKIITIKRTKDLNYFSLCAFNLFNTHVSEFELNYWNKWTFPQHSNLLRCTCIYTVYKTKMKTFWNVNTRKSQNCKDCFAKELKNGYCDYLWQFCIFSFAINSNSRAWGLQRQGHRFNSPLKQGLIKCLPWTYFNVTLDKKAVKKNLIRKI